MRVFIIGVTGGVGSRLARSLRTRGDSVSGLVRRADQRDELRAVGVDAVVGDLTKLTATDLAELMGDVDAVVFTAGAGGGGAEATALTDRDGVLTAIDAARKVGAHRFGLVSAFPEAWRERNLGEVFDHYIAMKKDADIALTQSGLDWIILRPSVLLDDSGLGAISLGPAQRHEAVTRDDVAETLATLLHDAAISRQILELTQGDVPIGEAVAANRRPS